MTTTPTSTRVLIFAALAMLSPSLLLAQQSAPKAGVKLAHSQAQPVDRCVSQGRLAYEACMTRTGDDREQCLRDYDAAANTCENPGPPPKGNESKNVYRIPYTDGTMAHINRDFYDHHPKGRIDMHAKGGGTHRVVTAAAGTIRHIQDSRSKQQHPEDWLRNTPDCLNNFVWIEHANGEWSKYSHMLFGTTTTKAKLKVGDKVAQGAYLGDEGNVGCAWPAHLHFQIMQVRPDDSDPAISSTDGGLVGYPFESERNPRFSDLKGKVFTLKDGEDYVAGGLPTCRKDTECPAGNYCNAGLDLSTNRCMPLKGDNDTCDIAGGSHQCNSGYCQFGRCYTPHSVAMGDTCYVNDACEQGKCSDVQGLKGRCVCERDTDCSDGKYCNAGLDLNLNSCINLKADNDTCDLVGGGHQCKSGFCKYSRCYTPNSVPMLASIASISPSVVRP